jgi:starch phosphorylase
MRCARRSPATKGDVERIVERVSLVDENGDRKIRMANLAIVGSHSTNGVAAIHSGLLRTITVKELANLFPERFSNKTNGVTPRRWLLLSNPSLANSITEAIGEGWITDLSQLRRLTPLADDKAFRLAFLKAKRDSKVRFSDWLKATSGVSINPDTIFDSQIKRIHEYKRQLLNALRIVIDYNRLRQNPALDMAPRTFLFSGKAAPAYHLAKLIILTPTRRYVRARKYARVEAASGPSRIHRVTGQRPQSADSISTHVTLILTSVPVRIRKPFALTLWPA